MTVTIFGGDLRTGLIRVRNIAAESGSCRVTLGAAGTIDATVRLPMQDPMTDAILPLPEILIPGRSFLGWEEDGKILNAGPIWSDAYNFDTKRHQMNAAGLRSYWQYRYVLPALNDADPDDLPSGKDTVFLPADGLHLRTIAKRLVQQAQSWNGGSVPVVFEEDFPGDAQRSYKGHELHVVDEKLAQMSEVIGGPDIMFNPRYTDESRTHIEWLMETGNPQLTQLGAPHRWTASSLPNPAIRGASLVRDASILTTDNYQIGSTPEPDEGEELPEGAEDYPLIAKSVDTYLWGPDEYGAWTTQRTNGALNPLQVSGGSSAEIKPAAGFTSAFQTGIVGAPGDPTTACRFTRNAASPTTITASNKWYGDMYVSTPGTAGDWIAQPISPGRVRVSVWVRSNRDSSFVLRVRPFKIAAPAWTSARTTSAAVALAGGAWTQLSVEITAPADSTHIAVEVGQQTAFAWALNDWWEQSRLIVGDLPFIAGDSDIDVDERTRWAAAANASPTLFQTRSVIQPSRKFPRLETSEDRSSVINLPVLQSYADQATNVGRKAQETWKFNAKKDVVPTIGTYSVGDFGVLVTKDDPRVGTGEQKLRIMEISTKLGDSFASLSCAPRREDIG